MFHWQAVGMKKGLHPNPFFNAPYYLGRYKDLRKAFGPDNYEMATKHWQETGIAEGRQGSVLFHSEYYLKHNKDVREKVGKRDANGALSHFVRTGAAEGRKPAAFDVEWDLEVECLMTALATKVGGPPKSLADAFRIAAQLIIACPVFVPKEEFSIEVKDYEKADIRFDRDHDRQNAAGERMEARESRGEIIS